jgi:hypothetical protein
MEKFKLFLKHCWIVLMPGICGIYSLIKCFSTEPWYKSVSDGVCAAYAIIMAIVLIVSLIKTPTEGYIMTPDGPIYETKEDAIEAMIKELEKEKENIRKTEK